MYLSNMPGIHFTLRFHKFKIEIKKVNGIDEDDYVRRQVGVWKEIERASFRCWSACTSAQVRWS